MDISLHDVAWDDLRVLHRVRSTRDGREGFISHLDERDDHTVSITWNPDACGVVPCEHFKRTESSVYHGKHFENGALVMIEGEHGEQ